MQALVPSLRSPALPRLVRFGFVFHHDVLVGKEFSSSYKIDSTYFSPATAKKVKQGMSETEVVALMGPANGEYRFPLTNDPNGRALIYLYAQTIGFTSKVLTLIVELDDNAIVTKAEFTQIGA